MAKSIENFRGNLSHEEDNEFHKELSMNHISSFCIGIGNPNILATPKEKGRVKF